MLFESHLNYTLEQINDHYSKYRISDALMSTYKLIWDDFCGLYLERIKPGFENKIQKPIDKITLSKTKEIFEKLLKILHPFMPFITEELWDLLEKRKDKERLIIAQWPEQEDYKKDLIEAWDKLKRDNAIINKIRSENDIKPSEKINVLFHDPNEKGYFEKFNELYTASSGSTFYYLPKVEWNETKNYYSDATGLTYGFQFSIDKEKEKKRIIKELEYTKGFLKAVISKLNNQKFVSNAKPEVVDNERKKQADAEAKIKALEEQLGGLK